eukprot:TRINITY_DN3188_c0_g1_i1.p1 TRINITY_DN3188_c0_g1~~TRINITY_DN3188_c0_g1_i1.p1  ORF type:complete len:423 (-),score=70.73 TRINITY_DN3188_c0_g1_i1:217-1485(-)
MEEGSSPQTKSQLFSLQKEHELRVEVAINQTASLTMSRGTAEIFGAEIAENRKYTFTGVNIAVFTWHGCNIEVVGECHAYVANETPMISYINTHVYIEEKRRQAQEKGNHAGPRVMIVGPADTGKTSVCKILLNYAIRRGYQPTFVDLDVSQGDVSVPGTLAATSCTRPIDYEEGFSSSAPLVYFYGHLNPTENLKLYKLQISYLARDLNKRAEIHKEIGHSGLIINSCGWVDGAGSDLIRYCIESFSADVVLVIDHERLYNDLNQDLSKKNIRLFKLAKSGGVVPKSQIARRKKKMNSIREYFYGITGDLCPHSTVVDFNDVIILTVGGGPAAPVSALPVGAESTVDPTRVQVVTPNRDLVHSVLGLSHAKSIDTVLATNLVGLVHITEVNIERRKITLLAPSPGPLPTKYLIMGSVKWLE